MLYPKMTKKGPFSVEASGYEKKEGESIPRRHPKSKDKLISKPSDEVSTVYENFRRSAAKFGNAKALGTRKLIKTHTENKKVKKIVDGQETEVDKKWTYFELSGYSYMSFVEYEKLALQCGSGLRNLGMEKDDKMHLYGASRYARWTTAVGYRTDTFKVHIGLPWAMQLPLSLLLSSQLMIHLANRAFDTPFYKPAPKPYSLIRTFCLP